MDGLLLRIQNLNIAIMVTKIQKLKKSGFNYLVHSVDLVKSFSYNFQKTFHALKLQLKLAEKGE